MNTKRLTSYVGLVMLLDIAVDWSYHEYAKDTVATKDITPYFSIIIGIFPRMAKMITAPLVFSTLVVGPAGMSGGRSVGRVGLRVMIWSVCASTTSLALGMLLTDFFQPGVYMNLALLDVSAASGLKTGDLTLKAFITHVFLRSIVEVMATNEILQILVLSLLFGAALSMMKNLMDNVIGRGLGELTKLMFHTTDYVMCFTPLGVFAAMAAVIMVEGVGVLWTYGKLIGESYLGLTLLWAILSLVGYVLLGRSLGRLLGLIREPTLLAFATASSESAHLRTIGALDRFGVPKRISSFVLPLDCSFNLDGSMMYQAFVVLFIAWAYNIEMSFTQQVTLSLVLMLTSKGTAGVARISLVVAAATLPMFHLPEAGLLPIIGIDQFFDVGRTATNATSSSLATVVVAKYEPAEDGAVADVAEPAVQPTVD